MSGSVPQPHTPEGRAGLAAILTSPGRALVALDYDGTLAPIVADPRAARAHPLAVPVLRRLAPLVGALAVITGRPARTAVDLGGFGDVSGLVVLGHYGRERWQDGALTSPESPPGVVEARERLPELLAGAGAPEGTWVEDKGHALAVHTRRTADPQAALDLLANPLAELADRAGLLVEPGRFVIELRPRGTDKGAALTALAGERRAGPVMFAGDDRGDLAAFAALRALRAAGHPGLAVASSSTEVTELADRADLVVDGPGGIVALLGSLADALSHPGA